MINRLDRLKALAEERPNDSFTLFALAKELEKVGEIEASLKKYYQIIEVDSKYIGTYYHLGKLLEQDNQENEALIVYEKGIQVAQDIKDLHALAELKNAYLNLQLEMDL